MRREWAACQSSPARLPVPDVNNQGLEGQIRYLTETQGARQARSMLEDCLPEIGENAPA